MRLLFTMMMAVAVLGPVVGAQTLAAVEVRSTLAGVVLPDDLVAVGDRVQDGQPLVFVRTTLTASKGIAARAPRDGIIREVLVQPGQRVERGDIVVRLESR